MLARHLWKDFIAVTFSIAIVGIGLGCTLPLTALALNDRGIGTDIVGLMIAASAVGGIAGTFGTPGMVLRIGRRRVMMICFVLATLSTMPMQFVDAIPVWMLLRFVFGAAMAALFLIGEAWINTLPGPQVRGRVVAMYTTSFTLFQVAGPLFTNWLSQFQHSAFLVCGAIFLLGIPGILIATEQPSDTDPETLRSGDNDTGISWLQILKATPTVILGTAFFASFDTIVLSFLPLAVLDGGFSRTRALLAPSIVLAGDATLQLLFGWLSDQFGRRLIHGLCALAVCIMLPTLFWVMHRPVVWEITLFLLGGFGGAMYTLSMVEGGDRYTGVSLLKLSGLIGLTWNLSSSLGPALTGILMAHYGSGALVSVLFVLALIFLLCLKLPFHR